MDMRASILRSFALLLALGLAGASTSRAAPPTEAVSIVVFGAPSLGAFLPPVIKHSKFDEANGLEITFEERTPDAYATLFNAGDFMVGGSGSLLQVGLADLRGVKLTYLFNLFDFWGTVVTSRPDVRTLKDLEGKDMAAARGTTNYAMFEWFAQQQGVDVGKVSVINTATPGLVGYALADRAASVQLWEPAYATLLSKKPDIRTLDLKVSENWQRATGTHNIPYLGVEAHTSWATAHPQTIVNLYKTYEAAAHWIVAHPAEAANVISPKGTDADRTALARLIATNERLGLNLRWASGLRKEIQNVYAAGKSIGYLQGNPSPATIYDGPGK
jgi:NitT/TauT family transport system substrate-binding protein